MIKPNTQLPGQQDRSTLRNSVRTRTSFLSGEDSRLAPQWHDYTQLQTQILLLRSKRDMLLQGLRDYMVRC